jgi:hypothetical protein
LLSKPVRSSDGYRFAPEINTLHFQAPEFFFKSFAVPLAEYFDIVALVSIIPRSVY